MKRKITVILLAIVLICAVFLSSCSYLDDIVDELLYDSFDGTGKFEVHFIDVGQADSTLILCDGYAMLIDGGNAEDSSLLYSYLKKLDVDYLDFVVCTHAHEDHVGGLSGALNYARAGVVLSPVTEYDSRAFNSFVKTVKKQGLELTIPNPGDTYSLGSADFEILGPLYDYEDPNNTSIVIRLTYGTVSFIFSADAEAESELDLVDEYGNYLSSTVMKVGHHGSSTSSCAKYLNAVNPRYAVISCGVDNSYGHPHEVTLEKLEEAGITYYRTDEQGTIICESDGFDLNFSFEK